MKTRNKNTGSTQATRLPKSLEKNYFRLDDRSTQDMIVAAHEYARLLRYFDLSNTVDGDWSCFWRADYITLLATVAALDTDEIRRQYEAIDTEFGEFLEDYDPEDEACATDPSPEYYRRLLQRLRDMAEQLERLYLDLKAADLPLADTLLQLIRRDNCCDDQELQGALARLIRLHKAGDDHLSYTAYQTFFADDNRWGVANKKAWDGLMTAPDLDRVQLRAIFITFLNTFVYLKNRAQQAYDEALTVRPQVHPPHIALFLTFLNLFNHLQEDLNDLTTEHLDFYYEKVLGFERRPAQPDQAYLVFTLAKEFNAHLLEKGTTFLAGKENGRPIFFETLRDWSLSQAKVEEAKSVEMTILENNGNSGVALTASDLILAGKNLEKLDANSANENTKNGNAITLTDEDKQIGFIIASPQLLLREGYRKIIISIPINIDNSIEPSSIEIDFFKNIGIYLSSKEGWSDKFKPEKYIEQARSVSQKSNFIERSDDPSNVTYQYLLNIDNNNPVNNFISIEYTILLREDFPGLEAIESKNAISKLPCIKFVVDYTELLITDNTIPISTDSPNSKIKISVGAVGISKGLVLQNDIGVFNGTQQFLPFGPTAPEGAYFYLGSDEALNKRIDKISLNIEWLGWPEGKTLGSHYTHYSQSPSDEMEIECLENGTFKLKKTAKYSFLKSDGGYDPSIWNINGYCAYEDRSPAVTPFEKYEPTVNRGFLRFRFVGNLLHEEYGKNLAIRSILLPSEVGNIAESLFYNGSIVNYLQLLKIVQGAIFTTNNYLTNQYGFIIELLNDPDNSNREKIINKITAIRDSISDSEKAIIKAGSDITDYKNKISSIQLPGDKQRKLEEIAIPDNGLLVSLLDEIDAIINISDIAVIFDNLNTKKDTLREIIASYMALIESNNTAIDELIPFFNQDVPDQTLGLPNPPYSPSFNSIKLDYTSLNQTLEEGIDEFYYAYPFGGYQQQKLAPKETTIKLPLIPKLMLSYKYADLKKRLYKANLNLLRQKSIYAGYATGLPANWNTGLGLSTGKLKNVQFKEVKSAKTASIWNASHQEGGKHLYIGLSALKPGSILSLLFVMAEGDGTPQYRPPVISWYYYSGVEKDWLNFFPNEILQDQTRGLTRTGIIELRLPEDVGKEGNTLLNPELYWLRATAEENGMQKVSALPIITDIRAQAIEASYLDEKIGIPPHLTAPLPAYTISKLALSDAAIKKIEQPLPSFNGRMPESAGTEFYRRVSERLRHKDRAVTPWDYERLLLEKYPAVANALCLPYTTIPTNECDVCSPDYVLIATIPDLGLRSTVSPQPTIALGDLEEMRDYLVEKSNLFLDADHIRVVNPEYVPVCIKATAALRKEYHDREFYKTKLDNDLKALLAPWMVSNQNLPKFRQVLRKSKILYFIEKLPYVDFVKDFDVLYERKLFKTVPISSGDLNISIEKTSIDNLKSILKDYPRPDFKWTYKTTNNIQINVEKSDDSGSNYIAISSLEMADIKDFILAKNNKDIHYEWTAIDSDLIHLASPLSIITTVYQTGDETDHYITIL